MQKRSSSQESFSSFLQSKMEANDCITNNRSQCLFKELLNNILDIINDQNSHGHIHLMSDIY